MTTLREIICPLPHKVMRGDCALCDNPKSCIELETQIRALFAKEYKKKVLSVDELEKVLDGFTYRGISGDASLIWRKQGRVKIAKAIHDEQTKKWKRLEKTNE